MPTLSENKDHWNKHYDWSQQGDEWSQVWGNPTMQWHGAIFPRIQRFLPAGHILEIAPGFGRWTQFLKDQGKQLTVVDLASKCIEACKKRFADQRHIAYHVNDGSSLAMIPDRSIDFAFCFDSLVHVGPEIVEAYVKQLAQKLTPNGVAIIHHSNLNEYMLPGKAGEWLPGELVQQEKGVHWRDPGMSAAKMREFTTANSLTCITQEIVHWGTQHALIDCFSTFTPEASRWVQECKIFENPHFMREAVYWGTLSEYYAR